jgi:hypothetical protein
MRQRLVCLLTAIMNLQEGVELKAMADLVIQIDKVKMEKKRDTIKSRT